jgi:hypothetical protein
MGDASELFSVVSVLTRHLVRDCAVLSDVVRDRSQWSSQWRNGDVVDTLMGQRIR